MLEFTVDETFFSLLQSGIFFVCVIVIDIVEAIDENLTQAAVGQGASPGDGSLRAENTRLQSENASLRTEMAELRDVIALLREENAALQEKINRITGGRSGKGEESTAPPRRNPLRQQKERKKRKKRTTNFTRKCEPAKRDVPHAADNCPDCGHRLQGGWVHARRQIIDIPAAPAEVVDHVIVARHCGVCDKRVLPKRDFSGLVIGKHRIGVRLMSLVAHLHDIARMPIRVIQQTLKDLWKLSISTGEIVKLIHDVAKIGRPIYDILRSQVHDAPVKHGDETSWREDGVSGELWSFSTPDVRYFHFGTREGSVAREFLGQTGTVVCDFYAGYNQAGARRQRCWPHYGRALHDLKEAHPEKMETLAWVDAVLTVYRDAKSYHQRCREALASGGPAFGYGVFDRKRARQEFEERATTLARQQVPDAPDRQRTLADRIERFLPELFVFVEYPDVPSDNNAAERAIRPAVITRKVCGGTRSAKGTETKMVVMSLLHTWKARGLSTIDQCFEMLTSWTPQPRGPTEHLAAETR